MKNDNILEVLKEIGLSEKEAEVYLAAMSLGPSTIQKIAQSAGVKRTTVYSVIDSLKNKGMMIEELKGFKTLFVAQDPVKLERVLDMKIDRLRQVLPSLSAAYNLEGAEGYIKYYEGNEAVKSIYLDLLNEIQPHEDYCVMANLDQWWELGQEFLEKFLLKRAEKARIHGINIRMLFEDTPASREHQKKLSCITQQLNYCHPVQN